MGSLIPTYSSANRVIESDLCILYHVVRISGSWSYVLPGGSGTYSRAWEYTRTAVKRYRYVGMTKLAADGCAAAMRANYQRAIVQSEWDPVVSINEFQDVSAGNIPMADVVVQRVAGSMYDVVIQISETDTRLRLALVANPAQLFTAENNRDYDTED